jgi:signal transduction histidine kinase
MDAQKDTMILLDLMLRPGFCVRSGRITHVNQAAESYLLSAGMELAPLLQTGAEEYSDYTGGCLYLTLTVGGRTVGASVTRMEDGDIFLLDQESDRQELQSLSLVARELRDSLSSVMLHAEQLSAQLSEEENVDVRERNAKMNRGLFQMLRVVGNMSDANRYATGSRQELLAISEEFNAIFEKAQSCICHTGVRLNYRGLGECLFSMGDREQLERAVLNILSNALKFTPAGGTIDATLTRRGKMLRLTVEDTGSGMDETVRANVFQRYLRQPTLEDSRHGVGLGMVLIRSAAANHGGTVLIDQPHGKGTRVTMTMAIRPDTGNSLKSPSIRMDYAGGHDHMLLELSQSLPAFLYETEL